MQTQTPDGINGPALLYQKGYNNAIHSQALECSVCKSDWFSMHEGSFELSDSPTRVLYT